MTNEQVVKAFVNYWLINKEVDYAATKNLHFYYDKYFSYITMIAKYDTKKKKFILTNKKYSVTTSKHLNLLKRYLEKLNEEYIIEAI